MKSEMWMIQDLNCPACAAKMEKAVKQLPGVHSAKVAFASGMLQIQYDEAQVTAGDIERVIDRFGLAVTGMLPGGAL